MPGSFKFYVRDRGECTGHSRNDSNYRRNDDSSKPHNQLSTPRLKSTPGSPDEHPRYDSKDPNLNLHELLGGVDFYILSFLVEVVPLAQTMDKTDLSRKCSHGGSPATCEKCSKLAKKLWCARERALSFDGKLVRAAQRDNCSLRSVCKRWDSWFGGEDRLRGLYSRVSLRLPNPSSTPLLKSLLASFGKFITTIDISNQPLSDDALRNLLISSEKLTSLSLRRCGVFCGKGLHCRDIEEGRKPPLKHFALNDCKMLSDKGISNLVKLFGGTLLTISISGNKLLTDKCVRHITKYCNLLESLDLNGLHLKETSIRRLLFKCRTTLRAINIGRCESLSNDFVIGEMQNAAHDCLIYRRS